MIFDPLLSRCHWKWNHMWFFHVSEPLLQEKLTWTVWAHEPPMRKRTRDNPVISLPRPRRRERGEPICVWGGGGARHSSSRVAIVFPSSLGQQSQLFAVVAVIWPGQLQGSVDGRGFQGGWGVFSTENRLLPVRHWGPGYSEAQYTSTYSLSLYRHHAKAFHSLLGFIKFRKNNLLSQAYHNKPLYALHYSQGATCPSSPHLVKSQPPPSLPSPMKGL